MATTATPEIMPEPVLVFAKDSGPLGADEQVVFGCDRTLGRWSVIAVHDAGGLIHVVGEGHGLDSDVVRQQVEDVFGAVSGILDMATDRGIAAGEAAEHVAEQRLRDAIPVKHGSA